MDQVTYQMISKPGNKTAAPLWPNPNAFLWKKNVNILVQISVMFGPDGPFDR